MEQKFFKRIYSPGEFYTSIYLALRSIRHYRKSRKESLGAGFAEKIMLAVTEVNGCEVCSYVHTKMALEKGMSSDEIRSILSGGALGITEEEAPAIFFAQHYAETRGKPSAAAWNTIVKEYGNYLSSGILGAIRLMMAANIYGIALSALMRRLKCDAVKKSSLHYEVGMLLSVLVFLPAALVHCAICAISGKPAIPGSNGC